MLKYIKSFKEYIPTWIIAIFMFFGIFLWPLIIAIILMVIQQVQLAKMKREMVSKIESNDYEKDENISILSRQVHEKTAEISRVRESIKIVRNKYELLENSLEEQIKNNESLKNILDEKTKENEELRDVKNKFIDLLKKKVEIINSLEEENCDLKKSEDDLLKTEKFVLSAGKYLGGLDIPIGIYNLKILTGCGDFETDKPENIYFRMSDDENDRKKYNWVLTYNGIEISDQTVVKISDSANIEFSISRKYDFSKEISDAKEQISNAIKDLEVKKQEVEGEVAAIKSEMIILNNDLIEKYYNFSDYSNVTSQDCKNKLLLLKQKERNLREFEEDVIVIKKESVKWKFQQRTIRQIVRNFNMECDNIMLNAGLKNIDQSRNKIQKSFETLNKLYSIDGVELTKKILELKLDQITLMYTYELKYQQEKDIQKAIKEQMVEEAKAQREIEEQKKKIEKDLQQHLGEVNRLMKYLQKSQIDAEKQLYMDKIKELEDKIKVLEGDKETVLEREANAKAGFVYIISNIGSFGENIYKIGMTRRLEPMDRIRELSSASVPFEFDVHAMIFSSDAPELETMLHRHFADRAVNKVNPRKEFFNVDIDEIEKIVKENYNDTVQFTKIPIATEYRQSMNM